MPLLRAIASLADGFSITRSDGTILTLTSADIPANVKSQSISAVQTWVNSWLSARGYNAISEITTVTPLKITVCIGQNGADLSGMKIRPNVPH